MAKQKCEDFLVANGWEVSKGPGGNALASKDGKVVGYSAEALAAKVDGKLDENGKVAS